MISTNPEDQYAFNSRNSIHFLSLNFRVQILSLSQFCSGSALRSQNIYAQFLYVYSQK
jgi:hypothetical protein